MQTIFNQDSNRNHHSTIIPLFIILIEFECVLIFIDLFNYFLSIYGYNERSFYLLKETIALCWILAGLFSSAYRIDNLNNTRHVTRIALLTGVIFFGLLALFVARKPSLYLLSVLSFYIFIIVVISRVLVYNIYRKLQSAYLNLQNTIIIGNTTRGKQLGQYFLSHTFLPQKYLGFFEDNFENYKDNISFYLGSLDKVKSYCLENDVKEIYYAIDQHEEYLKELMQFADEHFIFLGIIPNVDGVDNNRRIDAILYNDHRIPVITSRKVPSQFYINPYVKRTFDFVFSFIALSILTFTIFPIIILAIKISSPGPIIYKQQRPGKNNILFWCYKFRTMLVNCDEQKQATKNDERITRIGAFLRKTSLDELPQFYNVLIGDMSVVGPRPNLIIHLQEYSKEIKEYPLRHWVTPGITGFAQVNGYRGETKEAYLMKKRVEHDLHYIENWSLTLDLQIIAKTILNIFSGEDKAY